MLEPAVLFFVTAGAGVLFFVVYTTLPEQVKMVDDPVKVVVVQQMWEKIILQNLHSVSMYL